MTQELMKEAELVRTLSGKKIIYVEDHNDDYETYAETMGYLGLTVVRAIDNGKSLGEALLRNPDAVAIISDIERPDGRPEGLIWAENYTKQHDALPTLLISTNPNHQGRADRIGVSFIDRGSKNLYEVIGTALAHALETHALKKPLVEKRDPLAADGTAQQV